MPLPRPFALMRNAMLIAALGLAQPAQAQTLTPHQMTGRGYAYFIGDGVAQSDSEALRWFRAAAAAGDAQGMANLGSMYRTGRGVAQSDSEAVRWYRAAAAAGNARGMYNLGWMYDQGRGVARDPGLSADWILQSGQGYANLVDDPTDLSPDTLRVIQQALRNAGYYTGALDGVFGPASLAALYAFDNR